LAILQTIFEQGKTKRWGVAWTFFNDEAAKRDPRALLMEFEENPRTAVEETLQNSGLLIKQLDGETWSGEAVGTTWTRQARRALKRARYEDSQDVSAPAEETSKEASDQLFKASIALVQKDSKWSLYLRRQPVESTDDLKAAEYFDSFRSHVRKKLISLRKITDL
jgi:hypothetical protein